MEIIPQAMGESQFVTAVWAIDPYEQKTIPNAKALRVVKRLLGGGFSKVQPIYICPKTDLALAEAQNQMQNFMLLLNVGETVAPHIYNGPVGDRSEWADRILTIAHNQNAQVILLTSHGRSTIGTAFLGSFARELLSKSDIPILFINPHEANYEVSEKVMFATDFSEPSRAAFDKFLDFVSGNTSEIILCHVLSFPYDYTDAYGMSLPLINDYREDQKEWAEREAQRWIKEAKKRNMNIQLQNILEESFTAPTYVIKTIAEREKVGLIGLVSHTGPLERLVIGSVTRDLMSSQKFNLWVCGPKFKG
jgi:nucleotide-binding universal stress UspA family protein